MKKDRAEIESMLDVLEGDLPKLISEHPNPDEGDFWLALAQRTVRIETMANAEDKEMVAARIARMLESRDLVRADEGASSA